MMSLCRFEFMPKLKLLLPQLKITIGGGQGEGRMHKRTTPRIFGHAIGNHIIDFSQRDAAQCAPRKKLIIELDGSIWNKKSMMTNEVFGITGLSSLAVLE